MGEGSVSQSTLGKADELTFEQKELRKLAEFIFRYFPSESNDAETLVDTVVRLLGGGKANKNRYFKGNNYIDDYHIRKVSDTWIVDDVSFNTIKSPDNSFFKLLDTLRKMPRMTAVVKSVVHPELEEETIESPVIDPIGGRGM